MSDDIFSQLFNLFNNEISSNDYIAINESLAAQKNLSVGDRVIIKYELPGRVSKDAPLSGETEKIGTISGEITNIIPADKGGQFSILAEQKSTLNIFVPFLSVKVDLTSRGISYIIAV